MINRIKPELCFKKKIVTLLPQKIAQTTRFDDALEYLPTRQTYYSNKSHTKISEEVLPDRFVIGIEKLNATLKATLQRVTRSAISLITRRYRADKQYGVKILKIKYSTDTILGKSKYLRRNYATQVYSHKCGFTNIYHMKKPNNENIGHSLGALIRKYGVPEQLTYDGAAIKVGSKTTFTKTT